jgi:hypothetical protein
MISSQMASPSAPQVLEGFFDNFLNEYNRQLQLQDENRIGETLDIKDIRLDMLLSIIKPDSRDRVLAEFEAYNKMHYKQHNNAKAFLSCFLANLDTPPKTNNFEFHHYEVLLGVPILVISDQMLDLLYDSSVGGLHMEGVGIVIQEDDEADFFLTHEMIHAFVEYLKHKGTFKEEGSGLFGVRTITDSVFSLMRNETIAYFLANPGRISKMSQENACQALTQKSSRQLNKINPDLVKLVELIHALDKSGKLNRTQVARLALLDANMNDFCNGVIQAMDSSKD